MRGAKNLLKNELIDVLELEYIFGIANKDANSLFEIEKELSTNDYKLTVEKGGNKFFKLSNKFNLCKKINI